MIIGTSGIEIFFDHNEYNTNQIDFLTEVFFHVIIRNNIDDNISIQSSISNLPIIYEMNTFNKEANNIKKNNSILQILEGNTMVLRALFGFTLIIYELSKNANVLCDGHMGFVYDFRYCGFREMPVKYMKQNDAYHNLDNAFFSEVLKLPIYSQSEVTIKLYAPNYSEYMVRSILRLKNCINIIRVSFETFLKYKLDSEMWMVAQNTLRKNSETDYLTKLFNRSGFFRVASEIVYLSNHTLSVLEIDIDDFKNINDTYGHGIGDLVLKKNAAIMREVFNHNCLLSRFGGEEFYILVINQNKIDAIRMLESYSRKIRESKVTTEVDADTDSDKVDITFTVSCGVSFLDYSEDDRTPFKRQLILHMDRADKALYRAKHSGKNCFYIYEGNNLLSEGDWVTQWKKEKIT